MSSNFGNAPLWKETRIGDQLREPIRNGYSPVCPVEPTGKWILHLGAVTANGFNPRAVKPAPPNDPKVDAAILQFGDVVVSRSNTRERVGFAGLYRGSPSPCAYPDLLMRVRPNGNVDPQFLLYALLSRKGRSYFEQSARGTSGSMVKIDRAILENFPLNLPPLPEQRKIAAILSSVDDTIEKTEAVIDQLEVVKKGLLGELLTRGMPGWHRDFAATPLGSLPSSWRCVPLREILADSRYGTSAKCDSDAMGLPVLRIPNVIGGRIDASDLKYAKLPQEEAVKLALQPGDLLVVRTNGNPDYVGRVAVVEESQRDWLYASYLIRLRVASLAVPMFVRLALESVEVRTLLAKVTRTSAGNYNLNSEGLAGTLIPLPPVDEQREIMSVAIALDARLASDTAVASQLRQTKAALLDALLSGHVRVTDPAQEVA